MTPKILIAGIGNIFLGDDAFGTETARRLAARNWPGNVRVVDFGIRGLDLTFALLEGYDAVILLDAAPRGGAPGDLYVIEPELSELDRADPDGAAVDPHGMNPLRVLAAAKSMGARFGRMILVGCEPALETADPEGPGVMGLSGPVQSAVEEAVRTVGKLVAQICSESVSDGIRAIGGRQ